MKPLNIQKIAKLDHPDVKDLGGSSEKSRKKYRMTIIKSFLTWSKKNKPLFDPSTNDEEFTVLRRQRSYQRGLYGFGFLSNFIIYQAFFTGIYNYRSRELLNMRKIPMALKFTLSVFISGSMTYLLYNDNLYDEQLYSLALKYRSNYDERYLEKGSSEEMVFAGFKTE